MFTSKKSKVVYIMITPIFEINQSDAFIIVIINAPFANVSMLLAILIIHHWLPLLIATVCWKITSD